MIKSLITTFIENLLLRLTVKSFIFLQKNGWSAFDKVISKRTGIFIRL